MQHFIARGICIKEDKLLLAYHKEKDYYFLVGGHIEDGESGKQALEREILEECGVPSVVGKHLTTFEHAFKNEAEVQNELTLIYQVELQSEPASKVPYLDFKWFTARDFPALNFLPSQLRQPVENLLKAQPMPAFISTL